MAVNPATRESTFAGIRFAVPEGCAETADTVAQLPRVRFVPPAWGPGLTPAG